MATVEQLYKDFGVLADAKDKAGEVTHIRGRSFCYLYACVIQYTCILPIIAIC